MDYETLASPEVVEKVKAALERKGMEVFVAENGAEALAKIKELVPAGVSVMNGTSTSLRQIGYTDYLKSGQHPWKNLHETILAEKDWAKQGPLRRQATVSDYYLGSVHALIENGEFVIASATGSQLPHVVFSSPNLVFIVSTKKIVPSLAEGLKRLEEHVVPQEDKRMQEAYGMGTAINKLLIFKGEGQANGRKLQFILVKENLGF